MKESKNCESNFLGSTKDLNGWRTEIYHSWRTFEEPQKSTLFLNMSSKFFNFAEVHGSPLRGSSKLLKISTEVLKSEKRSSKCFNFESLLKASQNISKHIALAN